MRKQTLRMKSLLKLAIFHPFPFQNPRPHPTSHLLLLLLSLTAASAGRRCGGHGVGGRIGGRVLQELLHILHLAVLKPMARIMYNVDILYIVYRDTIWPGYLYIWSPPPGPGNPPHGMVLSGPGPGTLGPSIRRCKTTSHPSSFSIHTFSMNLLQIP